MGAVAIWSMHFIGNRAIAMAKGQASAQIQYSPGFTAGSFFLPIVVVGIAFYFFSTSENVSIMWTVMGGLLTGFAVCGMHYMGQGGIANYAPSYMWPYVLGSAIIAVVATTIALGVFFYFNSMWTNSWWKRACCASLLAVAVSGMHWVATVGTKYSIQSSPGEQAVGLSREATVVVVICLVMLSIGVALTGYADSSKAIGCCMILVSFALIGQRSRQRSADRAQQVVLACVTFDPEGRLMVTPEGLLPCRKITDSYNEMVGTAPLKLSIAAKSA
jgi:NO-binding membrane sensor protein with MHYT domain